MTEQLINAYITTNIVARQVEIHRRANIIVDRHELNRGLAGNAFKRARKTQLIKEEAIHKKKSEIERLLQELIEENIEMEAQKMAEKHIQLVLNSKAELQVEVERDIHDQLGELRRKKLQKDKRKADHDAQLRVARMRLSSSTAPIDHLNTLLFLIVPNQV